MARKPYEGEKRESRISLIVVPSLYKGVSTLADSQNLSINEFVTQLLEKTVEKNAELIKKFQSMRDSAKTEFVDID